MFVMILTAAARLDAQQSDWEKAAGPPTAFEVASIRLSKPGSQMHSNQALSSDDGWRQPAGDLQSTFPASVFIQFAYKLDPDEGERMKASLPKWAKTQLYDLHAKAATTNPTKDQMRLMMQTMLKERFRLAMHREQREEAVLAVVPVRPGTMGPKLRPHADGAPCDQGAPMVPNTVPAIFPPTCGIYAAMPEPNHQWLMGSRDTTMALIAAMLNNTARLGRPAVDRTGFSGRFDFILQYLPDEGSNRKDPAHADETDAASEQAAGPTVLEAIREQLGLKFEPAHAVLETIVVDHIEPPSEN